MNWVSFAAGLGVAISIAFMATPEMTGHGYQEPKVTSRSQPAPIQVADNRSDEEISASKNYQPPDHWKWKWEAQEKIICEPVEFPWGWDRVCHTIFERPIDYPADYRRPDRARGGRPCPQQRQEPGEVEEPEQNPGLIAANVQGPYWSRHQPHYVYGPPVFGPDGRWHRTRRLVQ